MKYVVHIYLGYMGPPRELAPSRVILEPVIVTELQVLCAAVGILAAQATVDVQRDILRVRAVLEGTKTILTSPLQAVTQVDDALDRALFKTGLFQEFDVAGKPCGCRRSERHVAPLSHDLIRRPAIARPAHARL